MLYREIMAVCSQIHIKHINTLCGQNVELLNVKLAVHILTTGLQRVKSVLLANSNTKIKSFILALILNITNAPSLSLFHHVQYSHCRLSRPSVLTATVNSRPLNTFTHTTD